MTLHLKDADAFDSERVIAAIEKEEYRKANQGLISEVLDQVWTSDDSALDRVKQMAKSGTNGQKLHDAVEQYEKKADHQSLVNEFTLGALTSAPLMMRGGVGYLGAMGVEALESMNRQRSFGDNASAAFNGALRGGSRKLLADLTLGHNGWNFAMKGAVLGAGMYVVDDLFSNRNLNSSLPQPFNLQEKLTGVAIAAGTGAVFGGFNALVGNAIGGNPYRSMIATSGIAGFALGTTRELVKEVADDKIDVSRILQHGIANGAGYAIGAIPGAHQWAVKQEQWNAYKNGSTKFDVNEQATTPEQREAALKLQRAQDASRATDFSGKRVSDIDLYNTKNYPQSKEYQNIGRVFRGQEIEGPGLKLKLPNGEVVKGTIGDIVVLDKTGSPIGVQGEGYLSDYVESINKGIYRTTDYWYNNQHTLRAVPMSKVPEGPLFTATNKPFDAKPGDWLLQDGKGVTWGLPSQQFHNNYWEVRPRTTLGRLMDLRTFPTNEAVDTYLKTHTVGE